MVAIADYGYWAPELVDFVKSFSDTVVFTRRETEILRANCVILPGCTDYRSSIQNIHKYNMFSYIRTLSIPVLAVGGAVKLLCEFSAEDDLAYLGRFPLRVEKPDEKTLPFFNSGVKQIEVIKESDLFKKLTETGYCYFEQLCSIKRSENTTAVMLEQPDIAAVLEKNNFYGVQFLPERSGEMGISIMKQFLSLNY